jgi:hypothetical protein
MAVTADIDQKTGQGHCAERGLAEQAERQHRGLRSEFDGKKECCQHREAGKAREHEQIAPAAFAAFDHRRGERSQRQDRRDLARYVERGRRQALGLGRIAPGQPDADKADRQIDQEDAAPAGECDQQAADQWSGGQRETRACRPNTDRPMALAFLLIGVIEQR